MKLFEEENNGIYPVITLYQPWATWIMRGWKTIETRTHPRFACLLGREFLVHAGQKTDPEAINNPYLTREQLLYRPEDVINGYILGSVYCNGFNKLNDKHSKDALIDCGSVSRYGLFLKDEKPLITPIECAGEMGIWYYDIHNQIKVKK
jgi:hypothetical protein